MDDRSNTIAGWVLGSGIVALGLSIVSGMYFFPPETDHDGEFGYAVEVADEGGTEDGPGLAELLTTGSAEAGEAVFAKCLACHSVVQGGPNGTGPNLYGVMGAAVGQHAPGFSYSPALSGHGGNWTWENMDAWLKNPRGFAEGTIMSFAGLPKAEDRANLMLYLEIMGGAPPKPEFVPAAEEEAPAEGEAAEGVEAAEDGTDAETADSEEATAPAE